MPDHSDEIVACVDAALCLLNFGVYIQMRQSFPTMSPQTIKIKSRAIRTIDVWQASELVSVLSLFKSQSFS